MTDNRTDELLRKLLDERGVEHEDYAYVIPETQERCEVTRIKDYAGRFKARFMSCNTPGKVDVSVRLTPEQAIAATLGSGTCRVKASYDTADVDNRGSNAEWYFAFTCGCELYWDGPEPPNYCPNCGARVVDGKEGGE